MPTLWFITPAWGRYEMSRISLEQRARLCDHLCKHGVDANCVVVADDDNLRIARGHGFATVNRANDYIGAKCNDGFQFAAAENVDFVCLAGPNSWLDPEAILEALPQHGWHLPFTRFHAMVDPTGTRRADLLLDYPGGGRMVFPTRLLRGGGYRPIPETARFAESGLAAAIRAYEPGAHWETRDNHRLEVVGFKTGVQLTSYDELVERWKPEETTRPFDQLRDVYPPDLVDRIEEFYK